jgi:hypothetical protein
MSLEPNGSEWRRNGSEWIGMDLESIGNDQNVLERYWRCRREEGLRPAVPESRAKKVA